MLGHERQRQQQLFFDQVDEIELARAHDHFDFIVVERKLLGFLLGRHDAIRCIDIEMLRIRREAALTFEPRRAVHREPQIRLRRLGAVVLQFGLRRTFGLPGERGVAIWRIGRDFV